MTENQSVASGLRRKPGDATKGRLVGIGIAIVLALVIAGALVVLDRFMSNDSAEVPDAPRFAMDSPTGWTDVTAEASQLLPSSSLEPPSGVWAWGREEAPNEAVSVATLSIVRALERPRADEARLTGEDLLALWVESLDDSVMGASTGWTTASGLTAWQGNLTGTGLGRGWDVTVLIATDGEVTARVVLSMHPDETDGVEPFVEAFSTFAFVDRPDTE